MDCSNPDADFRILHRIAGVTPSGRECDTVSGATSRYEWALQPRGFARGASPDGVVFCLAALHAGSG
ncbi:LppU/SCO3897 family protein [Pseudonocardia adelaidensis]